MTGDEADFIKFGDDAEIGTERVLPSIAISNVGVEAEFGAELWLNGGIPSAGQTTLLDQSSAYIPGLIHSSQVN